MRKKIATLLLAFAIILPCSLLFTACGNDDDPGKAKVTSIAVELASTDYTMTDNTITVPWGIKVELDSSDFTVTATLDNSETKVISEKTDTQDGFTFSSTIPNDAITPIGEYSITFSHENVEEDIEIDVNVVKANVDMTGVEWNYTNSYTYDKTEKVVELTGLPTGVSVEYRTKLSTENGDGEVGNGATNTGSYTTTAIFTYSDTEHYNAIPNMVLNWEIEKADIVVSSVTTQSFTYDGIEKTVAITSNLPEGVEATITGEKTATNAGTYNIVVSFVYTGADSANYNPIASQNASWTISPAKFTAVGEATLSEDYDLTYNGADQSVELDLTGIDTNNVRVVGVTGLTAKNAGTHTAIVELEYIGTSTNYDRVDNIEVEWEIGKAPLTIAAKDKTITYGDSATNDDVEYTGFVGGENKSVLVGTLAYDYDGYVVGSNAGAYDITPSGLTSNNYEISFVNGTLNVEKKALTIKANDVTIDYNTDAINNGVEPIGLIPSDTVAELGTLAFNYGGYVKGSTVGTYDITVSGLDDTNYIISYEKGILTVEKIDVDVDVTGIALVDNSLVYTGAELSVEVDTDTLPAGVSVTNVVTRDKVAINVDEYVAVIYLQYEDTTNYNPMEEIERVWTIEKATVGSFDGVSISATTLIYTGVEQIVEVNGIPAGAKIDTISGNKGTNVDEYTVEVTFVCSDTDNYNDFEPIVKTYTWNITPATLTVTAKDHTIAYSEVASNNGYEITGFVNNETESILKGTVTYSYNYAVGYNVGSYDIIPSGVTADNYTINFVKGTLTVEKAQIDFTNVDWDKNSPYTYTGNAIKPVLSIGANNVEITYSYTQGGEAVENPINVGTYVAHAEIELNNDNYEIINNNVVDFEYEIVSQKVDVSTLTWNMTQAEYTGEQILPEITTLPDTLTVAYSYTQDSETAEPINVGTYVAHAELSVISNNYEIEGAFADLTYTITPIEVDCSSLAWTDTREYAFNGTEQKPTLIDELEGLEITYSYFEGEGAQFTAQSVVNAGTYTALVTVKPASENYTLLDYTQLESITFVINQMQIDVTDIAWENTEEFVYNGETFEPELTGTQNIPTNHVTLEYFYTEGDMHDYPTKEAMEELDISPINAGNYTVYAFFTFTYDIENYQLMSNGYEFPYNYVAMEFTINEAEAVLGEVGWNIATNSDGDEYSQYHNAIVEYTGEPIAINAVGNFDMFDIEYQLDYNTVEIISIESTGYYYINAFITLKDEYEQNYWFANYSLNLSLEVKVNPFETILIDDEEISYSDFANKEKFEYLSKITFTLKEGYKAYDGNSTEITSVIVNDTYPVLVVKDTEENEVYARHSFEYYYFDELTINGNVASNDSWYTRVKLEQGQDSFEISFDERYLTKYASMINYQINYCDGEPENGVITSVPFKVENATNVMNVRISLNNGESDNDIHSIDVIQYSRISEIKYTKVSFYSDEVYNETLEDGYTWINIDNGILVGFEAVVADGYTVNYFADWEYTQEVDFTDLINLNYIHVVVYSEGEIVETKCISISYNFQTEYTSITSIDTFNTTESEFSVAINNENTNITLTSLLNGNEVLELTQDITSANYVLNITYEGKTYTYSKQITIIRTLNVQDCLSEDAFENGMPYMTNTTTNEQYEINLYNNSISLYQYYDASTIKNLDLDALQFPVVEGYTVSEKSLVSVSGKTYLKLTLTSEQQTFALTESEYTLYILLEFDGVYDNDTSGQIEVNDVINGDIPVGEDATEINIDIATQGIDITLNNRYAKAVILDAENNALVETNEYGYISGTYNFTATGTYTLVITATDGTTKTYTINVTGEILPTLEVVVGDITLSQENGQYGPTEGDFEWAPMDENYTEMSFTAMLGTDAQSLINEGTLTITSVRSSMLAAATIYNNEGVEITSLENFALTVLGDETAPYVMFYAVATVQGQTTTSYIILYLCDELPAEKVLEVVVGDKTFTQVLDPSTEMPMGDFEMQVLNNSETAMEYMFIAYLGTYEEIPETLTLNSIYCIYTGTMTDLISKQTFTSLENVTLTVGTNGNDTVPCVAFSIVFSPADGFTMTVDVVLYLIDESEKQYPAVITIGENSYNFKLNATSFDFGEVTMDMDNGYFYITETTANQGATSVTITLDKVYSDYSYMVLIGDAYDRYVQEVEVNHVRNSEFIDALLATGTQAFRVTSAESLTMTIPIQFVDGLACFDIACEGFVGYLPEDSDYDLSFARVYIVIDGVGQLPTDDGGNEGINPGQGTTQTMLNVQANGMTLSQSIVINSTPVSYVGSFGVYSDDGETGYFIGYIGASAYIEGSTTYTVDLIELTEFAVNFFEGYWVTDVFNNNATITMTNHMATNVALTIGTHKGHNCVAFTLDDSSIVYLYMEDDPNSSNGEDAVELPVDTVFTITIGTETLDFTDFVWSDGGYIGMFEQNSSELAVDGVITATLTTNLEGEFELADGTTFSVTPNTSTVINIQGMEGMYAIAYDNQTYYFAFMFADTDM